MERYGCSELDNLLDDYEWDDEDDEEDEEETDEEEKLLMHERIADL